MAIPGENALGVVTLAEIIVIFRAFRSLTKKNLNRESVGKQHMGPLCKIRRARKSI